MSSSHQPEPTGRPFYLYNDGWCISLPPLLRLTDSDFSRVFLTWKVESFEMWWHISKHLFFCSLSPPLRYEMLPHHGDQALSFDPREELFGNHSHLENCICSQTRQKCAILRQQRLVQMALPDVFWHPLFCCAPLPVFLGKENQTFCLIN